MNISVSTNPATYTAYQRRMARISIGVFFLLHGLLFTSWITRIPEISKKMNLNESQLGMVIFCAGMGVVCSFMLAGWLINRLGTRRLAVISSVLVCFGLFAVSLTNNVTQLIIVLFLLAGINTVNDIAINEQVVQYEKMFNHGVMSRMHGVFSMGVVTSGWMGFWLLTHDVSIQVHFTILASAGLLLTLMLGGFLLYRSREIIDTDKKMIALPDKRLLGLGVMIICSAVIEGGISDWSGLYLVTELNADTAVSPLGLTAFAMMMTIGRLSGDWLVEKFAIKNIILVFSILAFAGILLALNVSNWQTAVAGFGMAGLGISLLYPLVYRYAGKMPGIEEGYGVAGVATMGFMGFLFGPVIIGQLAHFINLKSALYLLVAAALVLVFRSNTFSKHQ